jgi:hypothetical protein
MSPRNRDTVALVQCLPGPAKRQPSALTRCFWLIAVCVLAVLSMGLSEPAKAQTCSPVANGQNLGGANPASTTCTGAFNANINFGGPPTPRLPR